eukprot:s4291_g1.t1
MEGHSNCFISHKGQLVKAALEHVRRASTLEQITMEEWESAIQDVADAAMNDRAVQGQLVVDPPIGDGATPAEQSAPPTPAAAAQPSEPLQPQELVAAMAPVLSQPAGSEPPSRRSSLLSSVPGLVTQPAAGLSRPQVARSGSRTPRSRAPRSSVEASASQFPSETETADEGRKRAPDVPVEQLRASEASVPAESPSGGHETRKRAPDVPVEQLRASEASVPAESPSGGHETLNVTSTPAVDEMLNHAEHPLKQIVRLAEQDKREPLEQLPEDHGSWDGRWPLPSRSEWIAHERAGVPWPFGYAEVNAVQTARKEYKWHEMSDEYKKGFHEAAADGWKVWVDNSAVEVLTAKEAEEVSMDTWVGSYAAQQEAFMKEYPKIAAIDVGSMGYDGEESIYVSKAIIDNAQQDLGLALTYYQSYNTTHHDPKKYFDSLSDVDPSELALCSDTDFSSSRMNAYVQYSGDSAGMVQQPDGSYYAKCVGPGERWWAAPACRSDLTKTSAYGFPAAIAISNVWANFEKHVRTFRALHYWWVPDATFIEMQPQPIIFPRHSASEWAAGDKKTGGVGSYISKMVSSNLRSRAALVQDFISKVNFELSEVQNLLLLHKQSGATTYFDAACDWIKLHRSRWTRWIPDKTQCSAQFGLFNEKTNQFVQSREDQTDLICRACPSGHFSQELQDGMGSGTTHRCVACPVGTSQASGASLACDPCSKGEYQDEEAKSSCKRCEKGLYQSQEGQSQCLQCPPGTTTLGFGSNDLSDCGCNELTINVAPNETAFQCVPCSEGLYCPFSSTIQRLKDGPALANDQSKDFLPVVKEGYYASQESPTSVYACKPAHMCLRGRPGECGGGLQGVPCAICPDGQTWSEDQCVDCGLAGSPVAWLFGILIGLAGLVALYYVSNTQVTPQASPIKVLTMALALTVNVMQTVSLMGMMTVPWPREMDATSSGLQFMVLDVQSLSLQCFFGSGAVARYTSVAAVFPIILMWLLTCSLTSGLFPKCAPLRRFRPWTWPATFNAMGLLLQVAFSTVSAVVMQPLMCYSHPNGMRSLLKYPNVMCGESEQTSMLVVGLIMGSVFVLAFYVGCIYAACHMPLWSVKEMTAALSSFRFLGRRFSPFNSQLVG